MNTTTKRGFTLLELLIVIAILAILATVVVLVLNPAEYLRQSRDAQRLTDMDTIRGAINLYLSDQSASADLNGPALPPAGCASDATGFRYQYALATTNSFVRTGTETAVASRAVNGSGWLPIDFSAVTNGAPLSTLPVDPTNSGNLIYRYACDQTNLKFELNACLESAKYLQQMATDGGDRPATPATLTGCGTTATTGFYEVGNSLTL